MKEIKLTQGKVTQVDDDDFGWLSQWKWHAFKCRDNFYAARSGFDIDGKKIIILMHREIMKASHSQDIDHKDGNGLRNIRDNLRNCNNAQNHANEKLSKNSSTGYKGVYFSPKREKFESHIGFQGKDIHLGSFLSGIEAALAYNQAAVKYFGEFARLNEI